jgi:hypothetical protein
MMMVQQREPRRRSGAGPNQRAASQAAFPFVPSLLCLLLFLIQEYKETLGPNGLIETNWVHGDPK